MALFPDYLYELTARDEQVMPIEILYHSFGASTSTNATQVFMPINYTVPADRILCLTTLNADVTAGAAQLALSTFFNFFLGGSTTIRPLSISHNRAPAVRSIGCLTVPYLYVPPNTTIQAVSLFDAGAASNTSGQVTMSGILLPRGNIQI